MGRLKRRPVRRAVVVIEAALVLPLVLLILFGILEYGWMFYQAHQVTHAARLGARIGITADATEAEVTDAVEAMLCARGICELGVVTFPLGPFVDLESGDILTVTVTVESYADVGLGMPMVPTPANLHASVSMVKEGP